VTTPLFSIARRRQVESRAARSEHDQFLARRAFADILESLAMTSRRFTKIALVGKALPEWPKAFALDDASVTVFDPAPLESGDPDMLAREAALTDALGSFDLVVSIGLLDHANDPRLAAAIFAGMLVPGGHLIGAVVGGDSLPALRRAMLDADRATGQAAQRFHPLMDGQSLAGLLAEVGLDNPVIDVDRVTVGYRDPSRLVADLRAMGCSRSLALSAPGLSRDRWSRVCTLLGPDRFEERFDLLHFAAWKADG
jgi:NADH dehydrogenase [ubiquinone] 1 alpha subcomplex assembly factor 5